MCYFPVLTHSKHKLKPFTWFKIWLFFRFCVKILDVLYSVCMVNLEVAFDTLKEQRFHAKYFFVDFLTFRFFPQIDGAA